MTNRNPSPAPPSSTAAGRPFAFATVVAVPRPTSARPGAHGIIHPGRHRSRAGSAAAAPSRSWSARRSARSPTASRACCVSRRTARRGPTRRRGHRARHDLPLRRHAGDLRGTASARGRSSGSPASTPIAGALVELGAASGFRVTLFDPVAEAEAFPAAAAVRADDQPRRGRSRGAARTSSSRRQGQWDEEALAGALRRDAATSGSSPRRRAPSPSGPGCARRRTRRGADRRAAGAGRHRPRGRDGRGGRALDPGRAGPGAPGPGRLRGLAGSGHRRRGPCRPRRGRDRAGRRRHRAARPGLRHDRRGARPPHRRACRRDLRVLQRRLPDAVRQGPGRLPRRARHPFHGGA